MPRFDHQVVCRCADGSVDDFENVDHEAVSFIVTRRAGQLGRSTGDLRVAKPGAGIVRWGFSVGQCSASRGSRRRSSALREPGIIPR